MGFREIRQPESYSERRALALRTRDELQLDMPILIDSMEDLSRALFGDLPSPAIVIGPDGLIRAKLPWAEPEQVESALKAVSDRPLVSTANVDRAFHVLRRGRPREAADLLEKTQGPMAALGMAEALAALGDREKSDAWTARAAESARATFTPDRLAAFLVELSILSGPEKSIGLVEEALALCEKAGPKTQLVWLLDRLAAVQPGRAAELKRRADALRE